MAVELDWRAAQRLAQRQASKPAGQAIFANSLPATPPLATKAPGNSNDAQPTRLNNDDRAFLRVLHEVKNIPLTDVPVSVVSDVQLRRAIGAQGSQALPAPSTEGTLKLAQTYLSGDLVILDGIAAVKRPVEKRQNRVTGIREQYRKSAGSGKSLPQVLFDRSQAFKFVVDLLDKLEARVRAGTPPPPDNDKHLQRLAQTPRSSFEYKS